MALNVGVDGANFALETLVGKTPNTTGLKLHLYKNDYTPADPDSLASYTEANFDGYAAVDLVAATWGAAASGTITYGAQLAFASTGTTPNSIYGYYITDAASAVLIWAERASNAPINIANVGDTIRITPAISAT